MLGRVLLAVSLVAMSASSSSAETAGELAARAAEKVEAKAFSEAAELYQAASKLEPTVAKHLCNTGMAHYAGGEYPLAHHYLKRCEKLDPERRKSSAAVMAFLEAQASHKGGLALYSISPEIDGKAHGESTVTCEYFDGHGGRSGGATFLLPLGPHKFRIEAEGYVPVDYAVEVKTATKIRMPIELKKIAPAVQPAPATEPLPAAAPQPEPIVESKPVEPVASVTASPAPSRLSRKGPWIAFGGAVVAGVGGVLALQKAKDVRDDEFGCDGGKNCTEVFETPDDFDDAKGDVRTWEIIEYALYGAAISSAALGVYLLVRDPDPTESQISVTTTPAADGAMVWLSVAR